MTQIHNWLIPVRVPMPWEGGFKDSFFSDKKICAFCDMALTREQISKGGKYCSQSCAAKDAAKNYMRSPATATCQQCGKENPPSKSVPRKFCSLACSKKYHSKKYHSTKGKKKCALS